MESPTLLLRHLAFGWQGFAELMKRATDEGVTLDAETLATLEKQAELVRLVIARQREISK